MIAIRIANDTGALSEDWKLITEEQIEEVMKRMPPGSEIYGSQSTGKTDQYSDLDVKLPYDIGEDSLSKLVVKTMRDLDLYIGAINISMPCDEHDGCTIIAHVDEGHLIPLIEHLKDFKEDPEALSPEKQDLRTRKKEHAKKFLKQQKDDTYYKLTDFDKELMDKYLAGEDPIEIVKKLAPKYYPN
jgi:hypothetical protein